MKSFVKVVLVVVLMLSSSLKAKALFSDIKVHRGESTAILMVFDVIGLNSPLYPLFNKNLEQFKQDFNVRVFRALRVHNVQIFMMANQVFPIVNISSKRVNNIIRKFPEAIHTLRVEANNIQTAADSKDIYSTIEYINEIVDEEYQNYSNVIVVIASNFRNKVNNDFLKRQKQISLSSKITKMVIYASSGLQYTRKVYVSQRIEAERNVRNFFKRRLPSNKIVWFDKY